MLSKMTISPAEALRWQLEAGVDETVAAIPVNRFASREDAPPDVTGENNGELPSPPPGDPPCDGPGDMPPPLPLPALSSALAPIDDAVGRAVALAAGAATIEDLRAALAAFDGCPLKRTATNLVFTDGNPQGAVLFVGEAPGAEEDRQGLPFVGPSGRLLDRMLASIGLDRTRVCISNTVFWRPPGNRTPTTVEMAVCMPFLERLIELMDPRVLVTLGGPAAKSVLGESAGVSKLRGRWFAYASPRLARPIPATAMFHPAYLLRTPAQKRDAWRDLLMLRRKLDES
ncbi:MAG: uracil-DNA glycosylase [Rhodospirillales bacterium]|nr:uracil-DNA glycosylase [Rhodospirillales bacterium]